jgi:hypothetical protein
MAEPPELLALLSKQEIRRILARHPGSKAELMRRCKVTSPAISVWLKHGTSAPTMAQAQILCRELLAKEEAGRAAKGAAEVNPVIDKLLKKGTGGE